MIVYLYEIVTSIITHTHTHMNTQGDEMKIKYEVEVEVEGVIIFNPSINRRKIIINKR